MAGKSPVYDQEYMLNKLLELAYDGIVVVDNHGIIALISKAYADFLGIFQHDAIGSRFIWGSRCNSSLTPQALGIFSTQPDTSPPKSCTGRSW